MSPREQFLELGYVVLEQVLPVDLIEAQMRRVETVYAAHSIHSRAESDELNVRPVDLDASSLFGSALDNNHGAGSPCRI